MTRRVATADTKPARDPEALVDELAIKIQSRILAGEYVGDEWLRQDALASEFGVSRTPVREALRKLEASGSLTLVPHRGARVRWPTPRETRDAYQVRAELEGLAAELAADAIVDHELDRLREAQAVFREAADAFLAKPDAADARERWQTANDLFHSVIHTASRNHRLAKTVEELHLRFPRNLTWAALQGDSRLMWENVSTHEAVLEAIAARDGEEARRLMKQHVLRSGELLADWFERDAEHWDRR
jgi:DNA-binding GntR family transcriptional regulator